MPEKERERALAGSLDGLLDQSAPKSSSKNIFPILEVTKQLGKLEALSERLGSEQRKWGH